jgi:RND family efflux transporter MFP subunit
MQPPDTDRESASHERDSVSTAIEPGTGARIKRAVLVLGCLLMAGFVAASALRFFHARSVARQSEAAFSAPPPVDVVVAQPVTAGQELVLPGQTAAWFDATIYARVNGYVGKWLADIGDHVKKGQVLAVIETPELDAELAAARAQLTASRAVADAREAEAEFSRTTNERWRDAPKGVVSDQERDSKKADFQTAQARLYAAHAQVALDKSRVDQYRSLAEFRLVTAPFDGTITERRIDVGNLVTAGSTSTTTSLYRMSQTDPLRVFVDVPQSAAGELMQTGLPAQVRAPGDVGDVFRGTITRSAQSINAQARTMRVEVDMPNTAHRLVPGMYVNVQFTLHPRGRVQVPAAALIFRPGGTQVARVGAGSRIEFVPVTIARDNGSLVELASGVSAGDRLVLNISNQIVAGQQVSPAASAAASGESGNLAATR